MENTTTWIFATDIAIKTVAAIEILADVSPYVMFEHEFATRMLAHELADVKFELVKDDQLLTLSPDELMELFFVDVVNDSIHSDRYFLLHSVAIDALTTDQDCEKQKVTASNKHIANSRPIVKAEVSHDAQCHSRLATKYGRETEVLM